MRWPCRRRSRDAQEPSAIEAAERLEIVKSIIALGQARIDQKLATGDSFDARAMAILSTDGVIMALVVATRSGWGRVWWVPLLGALISSGLAAPVFVRLRNFDTGADLQAFYDANYYKSALDAHLVMNQDVLKALDEIAEPLQWKKRWFQWAAWTMAGTVVVSVLSLVWR